VANAQVKMNLAFFSRPSTKDPKKSTEAEPQQWIDAGGSKRGPRICRLSL
jgi:hypothetical protein